MQTQHGCCWFQAEATFFASQKTRRADFDTEVKICTALGIAAVAFLLLRYIKGSFRREEKHCRNGCNHSKKLQA